jgi:predicted PP-loop superfamily ATPase
VPEPIAEMLQLEEINIQEQFDQPYLIWLTSGELANVFNRLSGMQRFDDWQVSVSSGVRSANSEIRKNAVDIIAAKEQLDRYSELPVVDKLLKEIIEFDKKISATGKAFDRLRTIYASIKLAQTQLASSTATEEECNNASQLAAEIRECDKKIDSIVVQLDSLTNVSKLFMFIGTAEVELYSSQADYLELLGKAGICDRCYGEIDSAAIDRIKERMQNE